MEENDFASVVLPTCLGPAKKTIFFSKSFKIKDF